MRPTDILMVRGAQQDSNTPRNCRQLWDAESEQTVFLREEQPMAYSVPVVSPKSTKIQVLIWPEQVVFIYLGMYTILCWPNNNRTVGELGETRLTSPLPLLVNLCYSSLIIFVFLLCYVTCLDILGAM